MCPSVTVNIISVRQLCRENCISVLFSDTSASIFRQSNELETVNIQVTPNNTPKEQLRKQNDSSCDLLFPFIENLSSTLSSKYTFLFAILQVKELFVFVARFRYFPNKIFLRLAQSYDIPAETRNCFEHRSGKTTKNLS